MNHELEHEEHELDELDVELHEHELDELDVELHELDELLLDVELHDELELDELDVELHELELDELDVEHDDELDEEDDEHVADATACVTVPLIASWIAKPIDSKNTFTSVVVISLSVHIIPGKATAAPLVLVPAL